MAFNELKSCLFQHLVPDGYAPTQDILAEAEGIEPTSTAGKALNSYAVNIFNDQNAIFILRHSTFKLLPHKKRFTSIDTFRLSHYRNRKRLSLNYDKEHSLKGTFQGLVTLRWGATLFVNTFINKKINIP